MQLFRTSALVLTAVFAAMPCAQLDARERETEPRWVQHHYGSVDGLPVGSASSARIDEEGFLWLATHDGLARFDGQRFDVHESMRFPSMSGNRVQSLHKDDAGRLFAHTAHGDWLAVRSGRIERAGLGIDGAQDVRHVDPDSLCLTTALALHCPDGKGGFPAHTRFPADTDPALALRGPGDVVWMMTRARDIWRHDNSAWQIIRHAEVGTGAFQPKLAAIADDGTFWTDNAGRLLRVSATGAPMEWLDQDSPSDITQLRHDIDGSIWIGAANGVFAVVAGVPRRVFAESAERVEGGYSSWRAPDGALWISRDGHLWRFASATDADPSMPRTVLESTGQIQNMLFGDDGVAWVMTLRDGIYRLSGARVDLLGEQVGLAEGNVYGVAQDREGTMWLGSLGSGLVAIGQDGQAHRYGRAEGLPGDNPWLVAAGPDGSVYAGTYAPGLWRRAPGKNLFAPMPLPDELHGEQVLAITFDAAQRLWLGTTDGAWRQTGETWQRQWPPAPRRLKVNALAMSGDDVWYGSAEGVWRQHGERGHAVAEALLSRTSVRDLYLAIDGALWISTDGRGLVRVAANDSSGLHALQLGRAQGLPSNSPHTVREDAQGHVWVNSNQGVFRISRPGLLAFLADRSQRLSPLVLGLSDGLTELEGNGGVQPAAALDDHGRLWFPSQRGVVRFDPLRMPLREHAPHAIIDGLESDGRPVALLGGNDLPVGIRNVLVRYGAADLSAGGQVRFRYRLLPQDQGWTDALTERSASFAALQPGRYRFELLAGNSDGIWAGAPVALGFDVPFRWYETRTARFSALAAAGLCILLVVRLRLRRLRERAAELDRQVRQRTQELSSEKTRVEATLSELAETHAELALTHQEIEDSNLRLAAQAQRLETLDQFRTRLLADVSHELRTPLMLVSLPLQELQSHAASMTTSERGKLDLSLKQLDRLGGLVEQLVGLVQAESGQMPLRMQRLDLVASLREIVAGYQPMAERAGISLLMQTSVGELRLFGDRAHLATVFGNLIDNAIKYAPTGSVVMLRIGWNEEHATVQVEDQGQGFDPALANRLFERFYRADGPPRQGREGLGIGLALARELVELHGGRITASSTQGAGSTFRVELPLGSAHVAFDDLVLDDTRRGTLAPDLVPGHGEGRALLVEDHPDLAVYLAERLGEHVPVTRVGSAEEAMQALADDAGIRLVVSDIVLPGVSGIDLCRHLANAPRAQQRPVILISAKAADADRSAGLAAGAVAYLAKPFSFEALLNEMARAWPEASPRLTPALADTSPTDPLLALALHGLVDTGFGITEWANRAHLSERQLRRRINELTGQSPQTWLREQRLLRVRHLLRSGACKTLAEAGTRSGLDNPAYLYRSYRARFGDH